MRSECMGLIALTMRAFITLAVFMTASFGSVCVLAQDQLREGADVELNNTLPFEQRGVTVEQKLGGRIPLNLPLIDSLGRPVKSGYFIDGKKPTIITLNYSNCPMLCNIQLNRLTQSLNKLDLQIGQDFRMLTVSIDPTESTERVRETKQKYVEELTNQPGAADGWEFCTARQPIITKLADVLGFRYKYDRANKQYNHPAMLAYVSPDGVISRYSLNIDFPPDQMKLALVDAGEGTVGSKVDQFILWCYSYDPDSNSYTPMAYRIMKLAGAATIGLMLACLAPYWVGRKRSPQHDSVDGVSRADTAASADDERNTLTD
ncbi:MAG: SCO family protein [Pirellulaceae bacterium]|nr:SCO family protein [Pirellulaceae bacterium]